MLLMLTSFFVLEVIKHQGLPLLQELGLSLRDLLHLKKELLNLCQICLILFAVLIHISDKQVQFPCPFTVSGLKFVLEFSPLFFMIEK